MTRRVLLLALLLVGPAACGGDDSPTGTAPIDAGPGGAGGAGGAGAAGGVGGAAGTGGAGGVGGGSHSPLYGKVIFNEVLIDGLAEGDPNGDGDADPVEDQFVELVNVDSLPVALDGCTLVELDLPGLPRHTFATPTTVPAGNALVIFGGGDAPPATATAVFLTANAADPGIPFGLHLSTPADSLTLLDTGGLEVARFCYGGTDDCSQPAASDQSLTRSPDLTGDFVPHAEAPGANGAAFSPGTRADGTPF
jgi:hypothetical protein